MFPRRGRREHTTSKKETLWTIPQWIILLRWCVLWCKTMVGDTSSRGNLLRSTQTPNWVGASNGRLKCRGLQICTLSRNQNIVMAIYSWSLFSLLIQLQPQQLHQLRLPLHLERLPSHTSFSRTWEVAYHSPRNIKLAPDLCSFQNVFCNPLLCRWCTIFGKAKIRSFGTEKISVARERSRQFWTSSCIMGRQAWAKI